MEDKHLISYITEISLTISTCLSKGTLLGFLTIKPAPDGNGLDESLGRKAVEHDVKRPCVILPLTTKPGLSISY